MSDSKRGSKTYALAMSYDRSAVEFQRAADMLNNKKAKGWFCNVPGSCVTSGYGKTRNDAFVDYVEECWCITNSFPKGYPE